MIRHTELQALTWRCLETGKEAESGKGYRTGSKGYRKRDRD